MSTPIATMFTSQNRPSYYSTTSTTSHGSGGGSLSIRNIQKRSSISIKPGDDPFAVNSPTTPTNRMNEEEWKRISEEDGDVVEVDETGRYSGEAENGGVLRKPRETPQVVQRKPSFIRSILSRRSSTKSTDGTPPALSTSANRRSRSSSALSSRLSTADISAPQPIGDLPRIAPLRSTASLVSLPSRSSSYSRIDSVYSQQEASAGSGEVNGEQGPSKKNELLRPGGDQANFPPARRPLSSEIGLAISSDLPTRHIVPDNARLSVYSGHTTNSDLSYRRSTSFASLRSRVRMQNVEEEYDPTKEDGEPISIAQALRSPPVHHEPLTPPSGPAKTTQLKSILVSPPTPTLPLASLQLTLGLPQDPLSWNGASDELLEDDEEPDHNGFDSVNRFWKAKVLDTVLVDHESDEIDGKKGGFTKEEIARIQGKALKLAFDRDIEILTSTVQPPSTTSYFNFTIPSSSFTSIVSNPTPNLKNNQSALSWDTTVATPSSSTSSKQEIMFHAVSLTVWNHVDDRARSEGIRSVLNGEAHAKRRGQGAKARKVTKKMVRELGRASGVGQGWETTDEDGMTTDGGVTESEWGDAQASQRIPLANLPPHLPFWLPFALVLVSRSPIYNIMNDYLRISWARYHQNLNAFSKQMMNFLKTPSPKFGQKLKVPVGLEKAQLATKFVAKMPGNTTMDWSTGATKQVDIDWAMWPTFCALDPDNLLKIAEIALSPLGRVLFVSSHSIMANLAVLTFQYILEQRHWRGLVHTTVHSRDLKILLQDPGPWLFGIPSQSRSMAMIDLPPQVAIVDLDMNQVLMRDVPAGTLLEGSKREKSRRRLQMAIGMIGGAGYGVPKELHEAFPAGRFRPFSEVEVYGEAKDAERLKPSESWEWDQERVLAEFDSILAESPRSGVLAKFLGKKPRRRRVPELDPSTRHIQGIVRKHSTVFVDRRDAMEVKVTRLNSKLEKLVEERDKSFAIFRNLSEKLTKESQDLKTRLEKERRESRRMTGQVQLERDRQAKLEASLLETENAREQAHQQLLELENVRVAIEQQRNLLQSEIQAVLSADETSPLYEAVYERIEALSHQSESSSRHSRPSSALSTQSQNRFFYPFHRAIEEEEEALDDQRVTESTNNDFDEEARLEAMKLAVNEALRSIQSRLAIVLENADQLEYGSRPSSTFTRSGSSQAGFRAREGDTSPVTSSHARRMTSNSGSSQDLDETPVASPAFQNEGSEEGGDIIDPAWPQRSESRKFNPRPFQLTPSPPPLSPDLHVTTRTQQRTKSALRNHNGHQRAQSSISSLNDSISGRKRSFSGVGNGTLYEDPEEVLHGTDSRQSSYDDDSASFVSAESFDTAPLGNSYSLMSPITSDEDDEERLDTGKIVVPAPEQDPGPVPVFTRASSRMGRRQESIDLGKSTNSLGSGTSKSRPISMTTIRPGTS